MSSGFISRSVHYGPAPNRNPPRHRLALHRHRGVKESGADPTSRSVSGGANDNDSVVIFDRDKDGKFSIDASGNLASGRFINGPNQLRAILSRDYREDYLRCLTEMLLTYALGRGLEYYDRCTVDRIVKDLGKNGYRFSSLVMAVVKSDPFQMRRGDGDRLAAAVIQP